MKQLPHQLQTPDASILHKPAIPALIKVARTAALEAGEKILEVYKAGQLQVELKADDSPLTKADKAAHDTIVQLLRPTGIPVLSEEGSAVAYEVRQQWPLYWLVDPLDGTKEFIKRNGEFTVNIALMLHNKPLAGVIYAPCLHTLYYGSAETGVIKKTAALTLKLQPLPQQRKIEDLLQRPGIHLIASRTHRTPETDSYISRFKEPEIVSMGSSLKFMLMAENKADLYPRFAPTMEWDTAAAHAILLALNRNIYTTDLSSELQYNKPNLLNPSFISF